MKRPSKKDQVEMYLLEHGSITPDDARQLCNSYRLADLIYKLKRKYYIDTILEPFEDCTGRKNRFARYILKGLKNESN